MRRAKRRDEPYHVERCVTGKKKSSFAQAKREARYLKTYKKMSGMVPVPYKCKSCGWWHVGNTVND